MHSLPDAFANALHGFVAFVLLARPKEATQTVFFSAGGAGNRARDYREPRSP